MTDDVGQESKNEEWVVGGLGQTGESMSPLKGPRADKFQSLFIINTKECKPRVIRFYYFSKELETWMF